MEKQSSKNKAYIQLHIAVFLFGFTAILGKLISLNEVALVWNRLWIAILGLIFIPGVFKGILLITKKNLLKFIGIGILVALHWLTFYGSIKVGHSASVTLACLATASLFTSVLEPLITRSKFEWIELLLGVIVILGIYLLSGIGESYYSAIIIGIVSAFLAALFSTLNKKYIAGQNSLSVTTVELTSGFLFISIAYPFINMFMPQTQWTPIGTDWVWLIILGLLCTSLAFALAINSLKELSAFVSNLSINLEPVYGILLAIWLLNEDTILNFNFYLGTSIILLAVVLHPILTKYKNKKNSKH
ncbi:MAG: DMT family transporter [Bacteroidia bacterium]|nr:DMT family transporter [Bacteroidia bacterium]